MDTDSLNSSRPIAGNSEMVAIGRHNVAKVQSWTLAFSSPKAARILFAIPRHLRSGRNRRDQKLDRWEKFRLIIPHSLELNARILGCGVGLLRLKTPLNSRKCLSFSVSSHHVCITEFSSSTGETSHVILLSVVKRFTFVFYSFIFLTEGC